MCDSGFSGNWWEEPGAKLTMDFDTDRHLASYQLTAADAFPESGRPASDPLPRRTHNPNASVTFDPSLFATGGAPKEAGGEPSLFATPAGSLFGSADFAPQSSVLFGSGSALGVAPSPVPQ